MNTTANENDAVVAYCRTCGKPLSESTKREVYGVVYCEGCLASRVMGVPPQAAGPMPTTVAYVPTAPNPALAFILGFIPGVGAMYNGQVTKGFVHVGIFALIVSILSNGESGPLTPFFGLLLAGFIGYMVFDAFQTAKALRYGQPVPDYLRILHTLGSIGLKSDAGHSYVAAQPAAPPAADGQANVQGAAPQTVAFVAPTPVMVPVAVEPEPVAPERIPISAIVLIGLGVLFLLSTMGVVYLEGRYFFPVLLIALGVWLAVRRTLGWR